MASNNNPPSLAQTFMRGPLSAHGSGPLTKEELEKCRDELDQLKTEFNLKEPVRSFMDDPDIEWRFGKPDFTLANLLYLKERTHCHPEGSLEETVEYLVKTWEMERSHKVNWKQHQSTDGENFKISANGGKLYTNEEANEAGNYNVLLNSCPKDVWDSENTTWSESHEKFFGTFAAFPWEVLEVFSGPPTVGFTWRHWARFTGTYEGNKGKGQLVEMFGFGVATVSDELKLQNVNIYFKGEEFIKVLRGEKDAEDVQQEDISGFFKSGAKKGGCPHLGGLGAGEED